jgi:hypothetical protein
MCIQREDGMVAVAAPNFRKVSSQKKQSAKIIRLLTLLNSHAIRHKPGNPFG